MDYENYDELYHHGIKGQKWGVRRFQKKDGSLTPAGERHRKSLGETIHDYKVKRKRKKALEKARATKQANKEAEEKRITEAEKRIELVKKGKISAKNMTDQELQYAMARKRTEEQYKAMTDETSEMKRFMSNMWNDAVQPAVVNAGRTVLTDLLTNKLADITGLNKPAQKSLHQVLKEQSDIARFKKEIADYTAQERKIREGKPDSDGSYDDLKREAEISKFKKDIVVNNDIINKHSITDGKKAINKVKDTMTKTKIEDVKPAVVESGEGWVKTASGIWLKDTTFRDLN